MKMAYARNMGECLEKVISTMQQECNNAILGSGGYNVMTISLRVPIFGYNVLFNRYGEM
jgi:hypothetical protein